MSLSELDADRWFEFARSHQDASPFHHPAWLTLLATCYRFRPLRLALTDDVGQIIGGLPALDLSSPLTGRYWVSLPFTDYCPLLTREQLTEVLTSKLVGEARSLRLNALELHAPLPEQVRLHTWTAGVRHTLSLSPNPDTVYRQFSKMHQRNIRKAERAGVTIGRGRSPSDMRTFYHLHLMTRQRQGTPIQPRRFFSLLTRQLRESDLGFVLTAHVNQAPVAAAVFLAWNGTLIYKYGASDPAYWEHRANNLLFWTAIRWGCENGYHTFDMGRSDLHNRGLREFKDGWGTTEEILRYSVIADPPVKFPSGRLERALAPVIRHSPAWVCRIAGELFYRTAALAASPAPRLPVLR